MAFLRLIYGRRSNRAEFLKICFLTEVIGRKSIEDKLGYVVSSCCVL